MISLLADNNNEFIYHMAQIDEYDDDLISVSKINFKDVNILGLHLASYKNIDDVLKNGLIPYSYDMELNRRLLLTRLKSFGYPDTEIELIVKGCIERLKSIATSYSNNVIDKVCFSFDENCITSRNRSVFLNYLGGELVYKVLTDNRLSPIYGDSYAVYVSIPFERFSDSIIRHIIRICKRKIRGECINEANSTLDFSIEGCIEPKLIDKVKKIDRNIRDKYLE